jgi:hypothetical protein
MQTETRVQPEVTEESSTPMVREKKRGFLYHYGPQAWIDMVMSHTMIVRRAWHICAAAKSLPNPDALPEQGCLLICKGAFEKLFNGKDGGLSVEFDPHLPETSCTVRMNWETE